MGRQLESLVELVKSLPEHHFLSDNRNAKDHFKKVLQATEVLHYRVTGIIPQGIWDYSLQMFLEESMQDSQLILPYDVTGIEDASSFSVVHGNQDLVFTLTTFRETDGFSRLRSARIEIIRDLRDGLFRTCLHPTLLYENPENPLESGGQMAYEIKTNRDRELADDAVSFIEKIAIIHAYKNIPKITYHHGKKG